MLKHDVVLDSGRLCLNFESSSALLFGVPLECPTRHVCQERHLAAVLGSLRCSQPCYQPVKTRTRKRAYHELALPALQAPTSVLHAQAYGTLSTAVKKALYDQ